MLGLLGFCDGSVWPSAALRALENSGRLSGYDDFQSAIAEIGARAAAMPNPERVLEQLSRAKGLSEAISEAWRDGKYPDVVDTGVELRSCLMRAYALTQSPAAGEFRGVWDHSGTGLYPGDWERTCKLLSDCGINAIFPNVLWPGQAHYPSRAVPASYAARAWGDQLASCLLAAGERGLQVHAWKICWNLGRAEETWVKSLEKQGRLQRTAGGQIVRWLCPSDPANVAVELDAISELLNNYRVDGIHLDYVRYPDRNTCFCPGCRQRFERFLGHPAEGWPESAATGALRDAYYSWRAGQITAFVRSVRETARGIAPDVKISVAVYPSYPECLASVGQDWGLWLTEGYVDFVCPMNYVSDSQSFRKMTSSQAASPERRRRVLPGIGVTAAESRLTADLVIDQIEIARSLGLGGFVLFSLDRVLEKDILPMLSLGVTRKEGEEAPVVQYPR